jgi:hypothetical protein
MNELLTSVTLATVRGHKVEGTVCTACGLNVLTTEALEVDCFGMSVCLAQNGTTVVVAARPIYVYVSGPLTAGQLTKNVRDAAEYASALLDRGYAVYLPHANIIWEIVRPATYEAWMQHDLLWVAKCDAVLRFPGRSPGADREVEHARKLGIPVYYTLESLYADQPLP